MKSAEPSKLVSSYHVSAGLLEQILRFLSEQEINVEQYLNDVGIDAETLKNPDLRIPVEKYIVIEQKAGQILKDPCFGLHMGQYTQAGNWTILGYMMMNCKHVLEAIQKFIRYSDVIGNLIHADIKINSSDFVIKLTEPLDAPMVSEHCYEGYLSSIMNLIRNLTGVDIKPLKVGLRSLKNEYIKEYKKVFGEDVIFLIDGNYMVFDIKTADIPALLPNQNLLECFENYAKEFLLDIDAQNSYTYQTKKLILSHIDEENLILNRIADELNISDRTLQMYLKKEGTEFSTLLNNTREQLARKYLREDYSVDEITYLLGYSDASTFRKAFKKWTGMTPGEYRKSAKSDMKLYHS